MLVEEKWEFPNDQWIAGDVKSISLHANDTLQKFKLDIRLKHDTDYSFQNLYIRTKTKYPSSKEVFSVTSLELANANGSWSGDCNKGTCRIELPLQQKFSFPEPGDYTWSIEPYMRTDTLSGIKSLTVSCQKAAK